MVFMTLSLVCIRIVFVLQKCVFVIQLLDGGLLFSLCTLFSNSWLKSDRFLVFGNLKCWNRFLLYDRYLLLSVIIMLKCLYCLLFVGLRISFWEISLVDKLWLVTACVSLGYMFLVQSLFFLDNIMLVLLMGSIYIQVLGNMVCMVVMIDVVLVGVSR